MAAQPRFPLVVASLWSRPAEGGESAHSEEELRLLLAASQKQSGRQRPRPQHCAQCARSPVAASFARSCGPARRSPALDTEASITECLDIAEKTRYSRFPLCEGGGLDRTLGVVHYKDLFAMRLKARRGAELAAVAWKLIYVPETARLEKLLQLFLERKLHMAIVVDEYRRHRRAGHHGEHPRRAGWPDSG